VLAWLLDKVISSVAVGGASTYVGRLLETGVACRTWGLLPRFNARCLAEKVLLLCFDKVYTDGALKDNPELEPSMFIRCLLLECALSCQVGAWFVDKLLSLQLLGCAFSSQVFAWLLVKVVYVDINLFDAEKQRPFPAHWLNCDNCDRKSPPSNTCRYCAINLCMHCRRGGMLCACYYRSSLLQGLRPRQRRLVLKDVVEDDEDDVLTVTSTSMSSALFLRCLPYVAAWIKAHRTALSSLTDQLYLERNSDVIERCFWSFYNWRWRESQLSDTSSDRHSEPSDTDSDRWSED
jgi:hypothetical protein